MTTRKKFAFLQFLLAPEFVGSDLEFLGQEFERSEFIIQSIQFLAKHLLIVPLALFQCLHLQHPAFHDGRAIAAALDEVVALKRRHAASDGLQESALIGC